MKRGWVAPAVVFAVILAVYLAVTPRTNQTYRHFVYMAQALLDGRVDLQNLPDYYHDVIRRGGKIYAPFPPVPALLLLPATALFGDATDQGRCGQVLAALAGAIFAAALRRRGHSPAVTFFGAAALAFGSVLWPATAIGTSWFFAQIVVVLAASITVWELAGAGRPLVLGAAVVAGWLSRLSVVPSVPVLAAIVWSRHRRPGAVATFLLANGAGVLAYLGYNALRFGDPFQTGYPLLSMAAPSAETVARWGFFNLRYVPEHLYAMFLRAPDLLPAPPYLRPSAWGLSLLFTSPVALRVLFPEQTRDRLAWTALILSMVLPMLTYFSVGWVQFGYRYSLDWWVFLLVILATAVGRRPRPVDYALLGMSVAVNALGVYWVRVLGW